jgi:hypothetical protein
MVSAEQESRTSHRSTDASPRNENGFSTIHPEWSISRDACGAIPGIQARHKKEASSIRIGSLERSLAFLAKMVVEECKRRSNNPSLKQPGIPVAPE